MRLSADRLAAGATLLAPLGAWLYFSLPAQFSGWYPVPLVFPVIDLSICVMLLFGAVWLDDGAVRWPHAQWFAVGALFAAMIIWGFSIGKLFVAPFIFAVMSATLSSDAHGRSVGKSAGFVVSGMLGQIIVMYSAGYLKLGSHVLHERTTL